MRCVRAAARGRHTRTRRGGREEGGKGGCEGALARPTRDRRWVPLSQAVRALQRSQRASGWAHEGAAPTVWCEAMAEIQKLEMARIAEEQGRYDEALEAYEDALRIQRAKLRQAESLRRGAPGFRGSAAHQARQAGAASTAAAATVASQPTPARAARIPTSKRIGFIANFKSLARSHRDRVTAH